MKKVTMEALLKVDFPTQFQPTSKNDLLIDLGGFEIVDFQGRIIPFDFAACAHNYNFKDNYLEIVYRSGQGHFFNEYDIDENFDEFYLDLGLSRNDITAKLLSSAVKFTEFYFSIHDRKEREYPHIMTAAEISFYDENEKKYSVTPEALASVQQIYKGEL